MQKRHAKNTVPHGYLPAGLHDAQKGLGSIYHSGALVGCGSRFMVHLVLKVRTVFTNADEILHGLIYHKVRNQGSMVYIHV